MTPCSFLSPRLRRSKNPKFFFSKYILPEVINRFPSMWRHIPETLNLVFVAIKTGWPSSKILKNVSVALNSYSPLQLITDLYSSVTLYMLWLCSPPPAVRCFQLRFCIKECRQAHKFGLRSNSRECSLQSVHVDTLFRFINL